MCGQTVKWFWDGYILKVHQMLNMQNWKLDIKEALPNANWHHVSASQNIVDLLTRRKSPKKLKSSHLWWHGPKNIMESQEWENLPTQAPSVTHNNAVETPPPELFLLSVASKCSTFRKFVKTFGWVKPFTECLMGMMKDKLNVKSTCKVTCKKKGEVILKGKTQKMVLALKDREFDKDLVITALQQELVVVSRITEAEVIKFCQISSPTYQAFDHQSDH